MKKKVVIFDYAAGEFMCTEEKDNNLYCAKYDVTYHMVLDFGGFKIVANKQHGVEIIQELVHGAVEMIHGDLYKDTEKRAMAEVIKNLHREQLDALPLETEEDIEEFRTCVTPINLFYDKYTELLTESLNAAFAELESK